MSYENVKNSRARLKNRIVYVMGGKCAICGYNKTNRALELHHINPEEKEFTISAIANRSWATVREEIKKCVLVCANCHREIEEGLVETPNSTFNEEKALIVDQDIHNLTHKKARYCKRCEAVIGYGAEHCVKCSYIVKRKVLRPTREILKKDIRENTFVSLSQKYEVSDNAIRKWCISYGLPSKKNDIKKMSDAEWMLI